MRHASARRHAVAILTTTILAGALAVAAPTAVVAAAIDVTPANGLDFGPVPVGETSTPLSLTLQDTSDDPAALIVSVAIGEAEDPEDFSISSTDCPPDGLHTNDTCTVDIQFTPHAQGARSVDVTVNDQYLPNFLRGTGVGASSGVAWGTRINAGPAYTWNGGAALARTVQAGAQRLHLAYATNRIGGSWATDSGKHAGIYYVRSGSGSTWSTPKRLNPSTQHAARLGVAAAGARVYVAWVSQTKIVKYSPTAPRVLYVRVNTSHGASTAWKPAARLSATSGRVDYPTVAATGTDAFVAWTDSNGGKIKVTASHDGGRTWKTVSVGSTHTKNSSGYAGLPSISANGSTAVVAWSDLYGSIKARVSTDHGRTWGPAVEVGCCSIGDATTAVRGNRIAVTWSIYDEILLRERVNGAWKPAVAVVTRHGVTATGLMPQDTTVSSSPWLYAPTVALQDGGRVAIAWAEEGTISNRWDLLWSESTDEGAHWYEAQTIGTAASAATRVNDWPSVLWPAAGTRLVVWNGWTQSTSNYRLYLRSGGGAPAGATSVAPVWHAGAALFRPEGVPLGRGPR